MSGQLGTDLFFVIIDAGYAVLRSRIIERWKGKGSDAGMHIVVGTLVRCVR